MALGQIRQAPSNISNQKTTSARSFFEQMKKNLSILNSWELLPSNFDVISLKFSEGGNSEQGNLLLKILKD